MAGMLKAVLFLCVLISFVFTTSAQTCKRYNFSGNRVFATCVDLSVLNSFLHWTYHPTNRSVNLAFRKTGSPSSNWVAWAINPTRTGMVGAQALVAYQSGGKMKAYTAPVTGYNTALQQGNLSFPVQKITAEFANNEKIIFATLVLPAGNTTVNQVWQEGPLVRGSPGMHPLTAANTNSKGRINFLSTITPALAPAPIHTTATAPATPIAGGPSSNSAPAPSIAGFSATLLSAAVAAFMLV